MNKMALRIFFSYSFIAALTALIVLVFNFVGFILIGSDTINSYRNSYVSKLDKIAGALQQTDKGFVLEDASLIPTDSWCILINANGDVIWEQNKPAEIPMHYSINDVAIMTKWYLMDYPIYVRAEEHGLLVYGCPKNSIAKYEMVYSLEWFTLLPRRILWITLVNIIFGILLALLLGKNLYRQLGKLIDGIDHVRLEQEVKLKEKGLFRELSRAVNETSASILRKNKALSGRDMARSNWIAGISHDIRTPLSVITGHAEALTASEELSEKNRVKAHHIVSQSLKIKNLINDLNIISSLEYDMQPGGKKPVKICPLIRNVATELINNNLPDCYAIHLELNYEKASVKGDKALLERAFFNLLNNSIVHNEKGCTINVQEYAENGWVVVKISDTGKGVDPSIIQNIHEMPRSTHGLGLPMVYRIITGHGGSLTLSNQNGFIATIKIPCADPNHPD